MTPIIIRDNSKLRSVRETKCFSLEMAYTLMRQKIKIFSFSIADPLTGVFKRDGLSRSHTASRTQHACPTHIIGGGVGGDIMRTRSLMRI